MWFRKFQALAVRPFPRRSQGYRWLACSDGLSSG